MLAGEMVTTRCPHCEQPLGGMRFGMRFGEMAIRIIDAVKRAGIDGIGYDELYDLLYAGRASKRSALRGHIYQINKKLEGICDAQISGRGGRYHMTSLRLKRMFQ
jgi:hypothetical protein